MMNAVQITAPDPVAVVKLSMPKQATGEVRLRLTGPAVIIAAAGAAATFRQAVDAVASCGRVVYVGFTKTDLSYETWLFPMKEIEIYGSRGATHADFEKVVAYLRTHPDLTDLIATRMPGLDDAATAMREWAGDPGAITKIIIDMEAI